MGNPFFGIIYSGTERTNERVLMVNLPQKERHAPSKRMNTVCFNNISIQKSIVAGFCQKVLRTIFPSQVKSPMAGYSSCLPG
ncbi:MAG: hypothetical protein IPL63_14505 [Saprospiraceae bacterium]|nr:hypothetical protein [Saprospiraceae bacterium]